MEEKRETIEAVLRMQDYIMAHYHEEISLEALAKSALYSPWHSLRAFTELVGKTPFEYIRAVRLSEAAKKIRDSNKSILDIALESAFGTHEGFTKAFTKQFGITPRNYRKNAPPVQYFSYYPITHSYNQVKKGNDTMLNSVVFTQVIERPKRKLILKRGIKAKGYFEYCEEAGCDVWGILESIKGALNESIGVWLPENMRKPGTSEYCQAVEVPCEFSGEIPEGFDIIDLPKCKYMVFQGEPFEEDNFEEAIKIVWEAINRYDPKNYGWEFAPEDGPRFQFAPSGSRGYIEGRPVREYKYE
jgi:AraC-like DNA-binding protein